MLRNYLFITLLLVPVVSMAINKISIDIKHILPLNKLLANQNVWSIENFSALIIDPFTSKPSMSIALSNVRVRGKPELQLNIKLVCDQFSYSLKHIKCDAGKLFLASNLHPPSQLKFLANLTFDYQLMSQQLSLNLLAIHFPGAKAKVVLNYQKGIWESNSRLSIVDVGKLKKYLLQFTKNTNYLENVKAKLVLNVSAKGDLQTLYWLKLEAKLKQLNLSQAYSQGEILTEDVNFDLIFSLKNRSTKKRGNRYSFKTTLKNTSGALYVEPYYIELKGNEELNMVGTIDVKQQLNIEKFKLTAAKNFSLWGDATYLLDSKKLSNLHLTFQSKQLKSLQQNYLDNLLLGSEYEGLKLSGRIKLKLNKQKAHYLVQAQVQQLDFNIEPNLKAKNINANIFWSDEEKDIVTDNLANKVKISSISWSKLQYKKIEIGKSSLFLQLQKDRISSKEAINIAVFDGQLIIHNFTANKIFSDLKLHFDAVLEPVSLQQISQQMQWPLLNGKISALIPDTHYTQKQLTLGGKLWVNLFDGNFSFEDVKITDPGTDFSQLTANINMHNVNLLPLTQTYDFGKMQGRIEGYFNNLYLENWQPIRFDMFIGTPENDDSKHLISQRAVDNLSSMGGLPGILSKGVMRFFENFRYDKLGLGCQLANGRCKMRGVENTDKGNAYYIVKGGGIPRIDIVGFERNVDWNTLLNRLKSIQQSNQQAVIK